MNRSRTYKMIASGLLAAVSILLTRAMAGNFLVLGVPAARLSLGYLPVMLAGAVLGPGWGGAVGLIADVLGFVIFPSGTYFPPITLTSIFAGVVPGLAFLFLSRAPLWLRTLLSVAAVQILGSLLMQTYWLSLLYGKGFFALLPPRALVAVALIPVYTLLVYVLVRALDRAGLAPNSAKRSQK